MSVALCAVRLQLLRLQVRLPQRDQTECRSEQLIHHAAEHEAPAAVRQHPLLWAHSRTDDIMLDHQMAPVITRPICRLQC
jgi:hypothetical protein